MYMGNSPRGLLCLWPIEHILHSSSKFRITSFYLSYSAVMLDFIYFMHNKSVDEVQPCMLDN